MQVTLDRRFRGPLESANGGYACGLLASFVEAEAVEVTLRLPPPLDRPLAVQADETGAVLRDGDDVVAEARVSTLGPEPPGSVSWTEAEAASAGHVRIGNPVFGECFVCGVRDDGDGLRIYAGLVEGREPLQAAPWTPDETGTELVWAAIDCPGAYAVGAEGRGEIVLGRMTASVLRVPAVGERCVVTAWPLGEDGRKIYAGTALHTAEGELLALARQTWIEPRPASTEA
jgi:hypothetical protein